MFEVIEQLLVVHIFSGNLRGCLLVLFLVIDGFPYLLHQGAVLGLHNTLLAEEQNLRDKANGQKE